MIQVYVSLIIKGLKTIKDVPSSIKESVQWALIEQGHDALAESE